VAAVVGDDAGGEIAVAPGGDPSSSLICFSVFFLFFLCYSLLFSFGFSSFLLLFCSFFSLPLLLSLPLVFIGKKTRGETALLPLPSLGARVGWPRLPLCNRSRGTSPLFFHHVTSKWVVFVGVFLSCFGEKGKRKAGEGNLLFPCLACLGEEEDPQWRSKRHRLGLCFFFFEIVDETVPFYQNAPFHLKEMAPKTCQHPTHSLICDLFNQVLNSNFDFKYQLNCILVKFNCRL